LAATAGGFGIPYVPAHLPSRSDFVFIDGVFGLACGAVFGLLLVLAERRRPLGQVSLAKGALWGFVAGCAVMWVDQLGNCAVVGALSGLLSVAAARDPGGPKTSD
jgi:hypothetical protein